MNEDDIEKLAIEAVRNHYNCNGKYACSYYEYCLFGNGSNSSFDCGECGADDFHEGFLAGIKHVNREIN